MTDITYLELNDNNQAIAGPFVIDPEVLNPPPKAQAISGVSPIPQVGWFYNTTNDTWTEASLNISSQELRAHRDHLLELSDWVSGEDIPQSLKDLWFPYRQALRDIPQQSDFPNQIDWPISPS